LVKIGKLVLGFFSKPRASVDNSVTTPIKGDNNSQQIIANNNNCTFNIGSESNNGSKIDQNKSGKMASIEEEFVDQEISTSKKFPRATILDVRTQPNEFNKIEILFDRHITSQCYIDSFRQELLRLLKAGRYHIHKTLPENNGFVIVAKMTCEELEPLVKKANRSANQQYPDVY
jgi:hypothetical protein